ncbi:hypothetical protein ACFC1T_29825 [Kitasatospora sp. NPDC056076]|uniref:hypothetical protein n=1 Tax=Kitasatospora sp. NPDC056076 TaxID=3345703 RepID=UPI0035E26480
MTRDDLVGMLAGQTPACGPAREALLAGGTFDIGGTLVPARRHFGVFRRRLQRTRRIGVEVPGLAESVVIFEAAGDEGLRLGVIKAPDQIFWVYFNAAATMVMACIGGRWQGKG